MPNDLVLGLDLSTRTGWALGRDFEKPRHGVWLLGKMTDMGRCLSCLAGELEDALTVFRPALVIVEAPLPPQAQTAMSTARLQFGLAGVAQMVCYEADTRCEDVRADEVRKLVLGRPRAEKGAIIKWCRAQGWDPAEDNDADALMLLRYRHTLARSKVMAGAGSATPAIRTDGRGPYGELKDE